MRLEYDLRFWDCLLFSVIHQFLSVPLQVGFLLFAGAAFFILLEDSGLSVSTLMALILYLLMWAAQLVFNVAYLYSSRNKTFLTKHLVEVQADAFYNETTFHRSYHYWSGVQQVVHRPGFIAVYTSAHGAHIIPSRAFASKVDELRFLSLAQSRLNAA